MQFCGDLHLFILPHWYVRVAITLRTIRTTINLTLHWTNNYQLRSARPYKQRKTPTSEHSGVITLCKLILAPPRGDDIIFSPPEFTTEPAYHNLRHKKNATRNSPLTWGRVWRSIGTHSNITLTKNISAPIDHTANQYSVTPKFQP